MRFRRRQTQDHEGQDSFQYQLFGTQNMTCPSRLTVHHSETEFHSSHKHCDEEPAQIQNVSPHFQSGATSPFHTCLECNLTLLHKSIVAPTY